MKKFYTFIVSVLLLSLFGCSQNPVSYGTEYKTTKPIKSVEWLELTKQHTDISDKVNKNSRVFVIQVNLTNENLEKKDINSTLHSIRTDVLGNPLPDLINPRPAEAHNFRSAGDDVKPAAERDFHILINDKYTTRHFKLMAESAHAYLYYCPNIKYLSDGGINFLTDAEFKEIGKQFDAFYDASVNISGSPEIRVEADNIIKTSPKISILLCDLDEDATLNNAGSLGGYFTGLDYYKNLQGTWTENSNACQAIYVDVVAIKREGTQSGTYLGAIPHEFNHLLNNSNKSYNPENAFGGYSSWFTEGLAVLIPDLLSENYTYKNPYANVGPWRFSQYNSLYNKGFRTWDTENYITYSLAYAYFSFLIRNYGGVEVIHEIQTNNYSNEEAITQALKKFKIPSPVREGEYANFTDTVIDFALSAVNFEVAENSNLHTFNKPVSEVYNGFKYTSKAIDLNKYQQSDQNRTETGTYGLRMIPVGKTEEIGDLGSLVQYAGTGTTEINVTLPEWNDIKMYCVIQNF